MRVLNLRPYTSADLDAMVALDNVCFAAPFRFSRASMKSFAEAKNACVVVASSGEDLAGFCILHVERSRRRTVGYVVTLDVAPENRRQGLATRLMDAVQRFAVADGCCALLLHVSTDNLPALSFYERLGFVGLYTEEGFYGDGLDALAMQKPIG